jgi:lipoprotein-anchoring transpeptidase ErfK/SrfK
MALPANAGRTGYSTRPAARNGSLRRWDHQCRRFLHHGNNREGLIPPSPAKSSPTRRTSGREGSSSTRAVIFSTSSTTPNRAIRYGVGVGAEGFIWSGRATVHSKQEWPDWYPPAEMLARKPELRQHMVQLQSGIGMKGGPDNPIGARALYLWSGKNPRHP